MYWLILLPFSALALFLAGLIGYKWRELAEAYRTLAAAIDALKTRQDKVMPEQKPDAIFLDGDDVVARAKWEHEQMMKGLNTK